MSTLEQSHRLALHARLSPSSVALYPFPLRCIVACHCHSIHSFAVQSHSGPRRSISLSLLPSDQHALPSRSVAGLPVLLRIGCDAQLACASRLSRFTLLGNDPTLRGLHPCISHRYLTVPFRGARRTDTITGGPVTGHATLGGEIAPALTPPPCSNEHHAPSHDASRTLDIPPSCTCPRTYA